MSTSLETKAKITHPYQGRYMEAAFMSFVGFASTNLIKRYVAETGKPNLAQSPIGQMVDEATGQDIAEVQKFIDWCVTIFGTPEQIAEGDI